MLSARMLIWHHREHGQALPPVESTVLFPPWCWRQAGARARNSVRGIMSNETIHGFTDEVGVAVVARIFLDHVGQDVAQPGGGLARAV